MAASKEGIARAKRAAKNLPELTACPFCKGQPRRIHGTYTGELIDPEPPAMWECLPWYGVKCTNCGVSQPRRKYNTREESDAAWNACAQH